MIHSVRLCIGRIIKQILFCTPTKVEECGSLGPMTTKPLNVSQRRGSRYPKRNGILCSGMIPPLAMRPVGSLRTTWCPALQGGRRMHGQIYPATTRVRGSPECNEPTAAFHKLTPCCISGHPEVTWPPSLSTHALQPTHPAPRGTSGCVDFFSSDISELFLSARVGMFALHWDLD